MPKRQRRNSQLNVKYCGENYTSTGVSNIKKSETRSNFYEGKRGSVGFEKENIRDISRPKSVVKEKQHIRSNTSFGYYIRGLDKWMGGDTYTNTTNTPITNNTKVSNIQADKKSGGNSHTHSKSMMYIGQINRLDDECLFPVTTNKQFYQYQCLPVRKTIYQLCQDKFVI